jgi:formyltetrahydrofolate-dependent phosphoribosylglycinamide formyltransferase
VKRIAVFASGRGSNFIKVYQNILKGEVPAQIVCLITDNPNAAAIQFAQRQSIPQVVLLPKNFSDSLLFGSEILRYLEKYQVEWIVLAGYLKKIPDNVVEAYNNKIVNIHPALLPAFGGKGMYGMHVHEAVYASGMKVSGVTIHLVNGIYDAGPIVMQKAVNIEDCRNPAEIAKKVLKVEHKLYSQALTKLFTRPYQILANRVVF